MMHSQDSVKPNAKCTELNDRILSLAKIQLTELIIMSRENTRIYQSVTNGRGKIPAFSRAWQYAGIKWSVMMMHSQDSVKSGANETVWQW